MPFGTLKLTPGVNVEETAALNQAGIVSSDNIRWRFALNSLLVEKIGGWVKFYASAIASKVRALNVWQDLRGNNYLTVGAEAQLAVISNDTLNDITPQVISFDQVNTTFTMAASTTTKDVTFTNFPPVNNGSYIFFKTPVIVDNGTNFGQWFYGGYPIVTSSTPATTFKLTAPYVSGVNVSGANGSVPLFSTTAGSDLVMVRWFNYTATPQPIDFSIGATLTFYAPTAVGGIVIQGDYVIAAYGTNYDFYIRVPQAAVSTASLVPMNGGKISFDVYLGQPAVGSLPAPATGTPLATTDWSLDNWGEILVACPLNSRIFIWDSKSRPITALPLSGSPVINRGVFIAMPQQILVAYGASVGTSLTQDPLLLRWSAVADYNTWTASATNQAGSFRIPTGSLIVAAAQGPNIGVVWTDIDVWSMQYIGAQFVFGFTKLATGCGLVGQHAQCVFGNQVYWMSQKQFFRLDGGTVSPLPCTVWDVIFQDIDTDHLDKVRMFGNSQFNEVWCEYPSLSGGTGEVDRYVKFNTVLNVWDYGTIPRTAGVDQSLLGAPIYAGTDGYLYQHETGYDAAGEVINAKFRTGWFVINDSEVKLFVDRIIPDLKWGLFGGSNDAVINITIYGADFPGGAEYKLGPYKVTNECPQISTRLRARLISLEIESDDLGSFWRLGATRYRYAPSGRN